MSLATGGFEILVDLAIDVYLPIQRAQRFKIILPASSRPGKPVAAVNIAGNTLAERTIGIVNAHLRYRAEDRMAADKLKEGIEGFSAALVKLETLLANRLCALESRTPAAV